MSEKKTDGLSDDPGFFYKSANIKWMLRAFYSICVLLVFLDFLIHRHILTGVEKIPAFYAGYGFVACVILVLVATQLRKVVMRSDRYYDEFDESIAKAKDSEI